MKYLLTGSAGRTCSWFLVGDARGGNIMQASGHASTFLGKLGDYGCELN